MVYIVSSIEKHLRFASVCGGLGDKTKVTDAEVTAYLAENGIEAHPDETPEQLNAEIAEQLKQQKIQMETQAWITAVTDKAEIKYYVRY